VIFFSPWSGSAVGWCLDVCHRKNTNASRRQLFFRRWTMSLELSVCCITWQRHHLYSLRDFWRHFGLSRAAVHSDCCFFCVVYKYSYLLTYLYQATLITPEWRIGCVSYLIYVSMQHYVLTTSGDIIVCFQFIRQCVWVAKLLIT